MFIIGTENGLKGSESFISFSFSISGILW